MRDECMEIKEKGIKITCNNYKLCTVFSKSCITCPDVIISSINGNNKIKIKCVECGYIVINDTIPGVQTCPKCGSLIYMDKIDEEK